MWQLALGAILFTVIMGVDIYLFAAMMKREFLGHLVFNRFGKTVLVLLCLLVIGGSTRGRDPAAEEQLPICAVEKRVTVRHNTESLCLGAVRIDQDANAGNGCRRSPEVGLLHPGTAFAAR